MITRIISSIAAIAFTAAFGAPNTTQPNLQNMLLAQCILNAQILGGGTGSNPNCYGVVAGSDGPLSIASTTNTELTPSSLSATRAWTLPAAATYGKGNHLFIVDAAGAITGGHDITLTRAGSDTINGATTFPITLQYSVIEAVSDGVSAWAIQVNAGSGTVTSVVCGTGLSGGTITSSGTCAVDLPVFTNSLSGNVSLNNVSNYFDGPSVAQGTSGTWYASGTVTLLSTNNDTVNCKLWDGTTVIASASSAIAVANNQNTITLSGYLASPAANIRISCRDPSSTAGTIQFNKSGNSMDSTISVLRID